MKSELNGLRAREDYYLLHEYLEEYNQPIYFHQFIERVQQHGLQYLGEADFGVMSTAGFPESAQAMLRAVSANRVEMEQYQDFLRNRMFRQTLLCRSDQKIAVEPQIDALPRMYVASSAKASGPVDLKSAQPNKFSTGDSQLTTTDSLVKAAMLELAAIWPRNIRFGSLLAKAAARISGEAAVIDTSRNSAFGRRLAEPLLKCYATGVVELSVSESNFRTEIDTKPVADSLARYQAAGGLPVTNRRHQTLNLSDFQRHVLASLDGTRDTGALLNEIQNLASSGRIIIQQDETGSPTTDNLDLKVSNILRELANMTLLV